jgi:integrase
VGQIVPLRKSGRHLRAKLNDAVIVRMRPGQRIYDESIGGLYAWCGKRGVTFRVMADLPTRVWKQKLSGPQTLERVIGRYPAMSTKAARTEGRRAIAFIKSGVDPKAPAVTEGGPTLAAAWADYKNDYLVKRQRRPNTVLYYTLCFSRLTGWHDKPLTAIVSTLTALAEEHARLTRKHGKRAANASLQFIGIVHTHARGKYAIPEWPKRAYVPHERNDKSGQGLGPDDLKAWWSQVQLVKDELKREALLFTLLTGLRVNDVATLREQDIIDGTANIREPKGGTKRQYLLPLSTPALACWSRAKRLAPYSDAVFGKYLEQRTVVGGVLIATGHNLRRSWATCAAAAGFSEAEYGPLMNHRTGTVTSRYVNQAKLVERQRAVMEEIDRVIVDALAL